MVVYFRFRLLIGLLIMKSKIRKICMYFININRENGYIIKVNGISSFFVFMVDIVECVKGRVGYLYVLGSLYIVCIF